MLTNQLYNEDCLEVLKRLEDSSIDAIVTDPPYGLGFMGKQWDTFDKSQFGKAGSEGINDLKVKKNFNILPRYQSTGLYDFTFEWAAECLRVIKPGGNLLSFGGTRTSHRMVCAIEDAGWQIRDTIMWVYGCLSEDTEVLTQRGYMPYHKLTKYDIIVVYDAENDIYKWEVPQRWQAYRVHEDTIYRIRSDNTDQIVSRNHNCLVDREGALLFTKAEALASVENMPILPDDFPNEFALQGDILLPPMQRDDTWSRMENLCSYGQGKLEARKRASAQRADDWREELGVERWSNLFQDTRQLCGSEIYSLSSRILNNGSEGRLCNGASSIGSSANRATLVTDRGSPPPQSRPDRQLSNDDAICQQQGTQALRSGTSYKTTLARIYTERYSGIIYCPTVSTGAFVARRNGKVFITGNSGFPKSLDISKAIDKQAGAEREVISHKSNQYPDSDNWGKESALGHGFRKTYVAGEKPDKLLGFTPITAPATPEAKLWEGYGTALKPAYEPITLAMKPLDGTFANNALKWGVAGLNIDATRIPTSDNLNGGGYDPENKSKKDLTDASSYATKPMLKEFIQPQGRFPSNFIHDGSQQVMELFPNSNSAGRYKNTNQVYTKTRIFNSAFGVHPSNRYANDSGSAARFFYCAKSSRRERDAGLEDMPLVKGFGKNTSKQIHRKDPDTGEEKWYDYKPDEHYHYRNTHPTVKPLALMEYLVKLVTRPGHIVLDPFLGSGTTAVACIKLGRYYIGCEIDKDYYAICQKRIEAVC